MAASAGLLALWLHSVIAPQAGFTPSAWLLAITSPWRSGFAIGGAPVFFAWLLGLYLSARGLLIGISAAERGLAARWFTIGTVTFVLLFASLARAGLDAELSSSTHLRGLTCVYFILGSIVTALDQHQSVHLRSPLRPRLWFAIALPISGVVGLAWLLVFGLSTWRRSLSAAVSTLQFIVGWVWELVRWLGRLFVQAMQWFATSPHARRGNAGRPGHVDARSPEALWNLRAPRWPHLPPDVLPALLCAAAALVVALFLVALLRKRERELPRATFEESTSMWSLSLFAEQWAAFWRELWRGLRARQTTLVARRIAFSGRVPAPLPFSNVRNVYRWFLRWAAARSYPRLVGATALEHAERLARVAPEQASAIKELTDVYCKVRYGADPETAAELERAKVLLSKLGADES